MIEREKDFLERNPQLSEIASLILNKRQRMSDWERKEVDTWFFPAQTHVGRTTRPEIFSKWSYGLIMVMVLTVIPFILFSIPLWLTFNRRRKKIAEIRELQFKIGCVLPVKFNPNRDRVTEEHQEYIDILREEGLVF